ncbi:MAG: hypothetical protein KDI82_06090 [Gammaproteobacteria bacterium]|nr:hypothetical protein [Gammaproteobacteria bacterium]
MTRPMKLLLLLGLIALVTTGCYHRPYYGDRHSHGFAGHGYGYPSTRVILRGHIDQHDHDRDHHFDRHPVQQSYGIHQRKPDRHDARREGREHRDPATRRAEPRAHREDHRGESGQRAVQRERRGESGWGQRTDQPERGDRRMRRDQWRTER